MSKYIYNLGKLFTEISESNADKPLLRFINGEIKTYNEINILSNKISQYLISKAIKKNDVVAIFNDKSSIGFSIMLACLKTGIIYTNLDPASPEERLNRMLKICKPKILFANNNGIDKVQKIKEINTDIINYTDSIFEKEIERYADEFPKCNNEVTGNTPAYIMFTSGSTGFPKGVTISHTNILNFIEWSKEIYEINEEDRLTNINPLHFDNSVFDFYSAFFTGASLIPVTDEYIINPRKMLDALNKQEPTIWFSVPSMLVYVLKMRALKETDLPGLRIVTFGGEGFPKSQLRNLWKYWGKRVKFINVYGPTECTCICSSYIVTEKDMEKDELLPLGPIASNFDFEIINDRSEKVKYGETGELVIGGPNVGLGYFNSPEKTKEAFTGHPFNKDYIRFVYKTGDLVRYSKDENLLYFCGRKDNQIKRMGYRIELEEIENALGSLHYVEENATIFVKKNDENGTIISCLRANTNDEKRILEDLKKYIPGYMMPDKFDFFEHLPKNQNGKIDRIKLKEKYSNYER